MKTANRAFRTLIRSPLRSSLLVAVLTVSVGLALIMITVNQAFAKRLDDIKSQAGTSITVRPAGSFGGGFFDRGGDGGGNGGTLGGATPVAGAASQVAAPTSLTAADITKVQSIRHVSGIAQHITVRYSGTELVAATPQAQNAQGGGGGFRGGGGGFQRPILITGTDDPGQLTTAGSQDATITAGAVFTADQTDQDVALVGQNLATANNLAVGSTFPLEGATFTVSGIYTTGTQFGDNALFIPLTTAQTVFQRSGEVDDAVVYADSVDNVNAVADGIRATLGTNNVDVTTELATFQRISAPLSDAKNSSRIGMIVALAASAAVILFSIGLVARQRIKEIGILKAVGASSWHVVGQFGIETAAVSVVAALVGALATFPLAQSVANGLVSSPSTGGGRGGFGGGGGGGGGRAAFAAANQAQGLLGNVGVAVSPQIFLYAIAIAIGLALIASVIPAWYVGRVKPAAVLRHE
jgi:putative ABC transport system permease protein